MTPADAYHQQLRRWPPTIAVMAAAVLLGLAPASDVGRAVLGVSVGFILPIGAAIAVASLVSAIALRQLGLGSRWYVWLNRFETLLFAAGLAAVIAASKEAVHVLWLLYVAHLLNCGVSGNDRAYNRVLFALIAVAHSAWFAWARGPGAAVVVAGLHAGFVYAFVVLSNRTARLAQAMQERDALAAALLVKRVDDERERIARDLHDDVASDLSRVFWEVQRLMATNKADPELAGVAAMVSDSIETLRAVVWAMNVDAAPWTTYAQQLEQRCRQLCGGGLQLSFSAPPTLARSPTQEALQHLARAAQEAVRNAARHAGATTIRVALEDLGHAISLRVTDDGVGLPPLAAERSTGGLRNLARRAAALHGELDLSPGPAGGLQLTLLAPQPSPPRPSPSGPAQ